MGLFVFKPKPSYCIALSCHTRCRRNFYPCFCTRGKCPGYFFQQYLTICPLHRYYIRIFEQIKTWCYCKIWIFSLQFVFICNTCICFNVKIYICIKPVLDLKRKTYRQKLHLCSSQSQSRFLDNTVIGDNCVRRYKKCRNSYF